MAQKSSSIPLWRAAALTGLLLTTSMTAMAQWQWIDSTGRKVFSDTAPPASVPDKNIIKSPGAPRAPVAAAPTAAPEGDAAPATTAAAPTPAPAAPQVPPVDKEREAKKKQAEQAEEARRKAEEQRVAQARAKNCAIARKVKSSMDSGVRLATTNAKGEREVMDDKARAAESRRMDEIIRSDC